MTGAGAAVTPGGWDAGLQVWGPQPDRGRPEAASRLVGRRRSSARPGQQGGLQALVGVCGLYPESSGSHGGFRAEKEGCSVLGRLQSPCSPSPVPQAPTQQAGRGPRAEVGVLWGHPLRTDAVEPGGGGRSQLASGLQMATPGGPRLPSRTLSSSASCPPQPWRCPAWRSPPSEHQAAQHWGTGTRCLLLSVRPGLAVLVPFSGLQSQSGLLFPHLRTPCLMGVR